MILKYPMFIVILWKAERCIKFLKYFIQWPKHSHLKLSEVSTYSKSKKEETVLKYSLKQKYKQKKTDCHHKPKNFSKCEKEEKNKRIKVIVKLVQKSWKLKLKLFVSC